MGTQGVTDWRKASYSSNGGGSCVEVGQAVDKVGIRDTKDHGAGPVLMVPAAAWQAFTARLK